jgi:hypothetical protein
MEGTDEWASENDGGRGFKRNRLTLVFITHFLLLRSKLSQQNDIRQCQHYQYSKFKEKYQIHQSTQSLLPFSGRQQIVDEPKAERSNWRIDVVFRQVESLWT